MLEVLLEEKNKEEKIALVENGNLIEYYEENESSDRKEGNIYVGTIKDIIVGMQSAFVDIGTEKNSFIHIKDILPKVDETKNKINKDINIKDLIKQGQKILVQIKKDSNEQKGARVSTHISIPSKYIVLMPNTDFVTISQKIEDKNEQERLIKLVKENISKENGAVIRTSAKGKEKEIIEDIKRTEEKWNKIKEKYEQNKNKSELIYKSESIIQKMLIDLSDNNKLEKIITNSKKEYETMKEYLKENPNITNVKLELSDEKYDLQKQIEKIQKRKIWLKCGGFITIDKTEALTAIDVNTGKYTGSKNLNDTIYNVNKEATLEIAKQLRLRDIGGIIIIDYIDMTNIDDKNKIENLLKEELKKDRSKTQVEGFTKLDLLEMTRKHICSHKEC